ncbi:S-formylglutathione hydrol [Tuber magnatum]|uniref:S-formylglutathione hydrolase n=1 Tax=Tuber magnatum TaxID=42249 RepID=A0A317SM12_9PEZI|nr:S-formylglutathione hydrol [Tuber magnatum]
MGFEIKAKIANFGGQLLKLEHQSTSTKTKMALNLFLPPTSISQPSHKTPILIFLSGLTCTGDNCAEKGFLQPHAARHGIAIVYPDTSPRGAKIDGEDDNWDFGSGAGFYVDATTEGWRNNYNMYTYINEELPSELFKQFEVLDSGRVGIAGHSMGGHGALTIFLKNPGKYLSVSAFAPISNPINCPWGQKAFGGYFGEENKEKWAQHDATELVKAWEEDRPLEVLIDVGTADNFYKQGQLLPENFKMAAGDKGIQVRYQEGYDHSYFFISSFAGDHVDFHAKHLCNRALR